MSMSYIFRCFIEMKKYLVGINDRVQSMRYRQYSAMFKMLSNSGLYERVGLCVHVRRGFVKDQDFVVVNYCPR